MLSTRVNIAGTNISSPTSSVATSTDYSNAHPYVAPVVILVHIFKCPGSIPDDVANIKIKTYFEPNSIIRKPNMNTGT